MIIKVCNGDFSHYSPTHLKRLSLPIHLTSFVPVAGLVPG